MIDEHSEYIFAWHNFSQLNGCQLYYLLRLRQQVFVVEQNCPYLDADGLDQQALHLFCRSRKTTGDELVGCLRILAPGSRFSTPSIGRLATSPAVRHKGLGRMLMQQAMQRCLSTYPGQTITISAQLYLAGFYTSLGFTAIARPYDEDGIPHIDMVFRPDPTA